MHNKNLVVVVVRVQSLIVTIINTKQNEKEKNNNNALTVLPPLSLRTLKENNDGCPGGRRPSGARKKTEEKNKRAVKTVLNS